MSNYNLTDNKSLSEKAKESKEARKKVLEKVNQNRGSYFKQRWDNEKEHWESRG